MVAGDDWHCVLWLAKQRGVEPAKVVSDAIYAYVNCIRADVPASFRRLVRP